MGYIDFPLDEDYPLAVDGGRIEAPFYGMATIKYRSDEDWWLESLTLTASNGKAGAACIGWEHVIPPSSLLFTIIAEYLERDQRERVEENIRQHQLDEIWSRKFDEGKERAKLRGTEALI